MQTETTVKLLIKKDRGTCRRLRYSDKSGLKMGLDVSL